MVIERILAPLDSIVEPIAGVAGAVERSRFTWWGCLAALVVLSAAMSVAQAIGLSNDQIDRNIVEYWVHGTQPSWQWIPYIHPPLYSQYMNAVDAVSQSSGVAPPYLIIAAAGLSQVGLVLLVAFACRAWTSRWAALGATALVALSPSLVRPMEQYQVTALMVTAAFVATLRHVGSWGRGAWVIAAIVCFLTAEMHVLSWFAMAGLFAGLMWLQPMHRRSVAFLGAAVAAGVLATTPMGLWHVLTDYVPPVMNVGRPNIGWGNPILLGTLGLWLLRDCRVREPLGAAADDPLPGRWFRERERHPSHHRGRDWPPSRRRLALLWGRIPRGRHLGRGWTRHRHPDPRPATARHRPRRSDDRCHHPPSDHHGRELGRSRAGGAPTPR